MRTGVKKRGYVSVLRKRPGRTAMELATTPMTADKQVKRHPIVQEMQESIQAFRAIGAEIELQPILDYLASRELREAGSGNILAPDGK